MRYILLITLLCLSFSSHADEKQKLIKGFCYALQASMSCDELKMRLDTEGKIEEKVGGKFRGSKSKYRGVCTSGLMKAYEEEGKGLCRNAWEQYGCDGSVESKLIQQNPFKLKNPILCTYR